MNTSTAASRHVISHIVQTTSTKLLSFFLAICLIGSCNTKPSHKEALKYYSDIILLTFSLNEETELYMFSSAEIEQTTELTNLSLIDSLKKLYITLNKKLDSIYKKIEEIAEIDKQINLKSKAITYLNQTRQFFEKEFRKTLQIFTESGKTNNQSDIDKLDFNIAKHDLNFARSNLLRSAEKFENKYKITQTELKKYGL